MLTDLQTRKLRRAFLAYDRNADGRIEHEEFITGYENLLRSRGLKPSHAAWAEQMTQLEALWAAHLAKADTDKDGLISVDEYLAFIATELGPLGTDPAKAPEGFSAVIDALMGALDVDGDGAVSPEDYSTCMQCFGIDDFDTDGTFAALDADGDGQLSRDEISLRIREFFFSDDAASPGNALWGPY
jgi:Ca2+-binding EF-hand superfamily protein